MGTPLAVDVFANVRQRLYGVLDAGQATHPARVSPAAWVVLYRVIAAAQENAMREKER